MTLPVELNTNINTNNNALNMPNFGTTLNMQSKPNSIFDLQPSLNNYDNDIMGAGVGVNSSVTNNLGTTQGVNFATNNSEIPQDNIEANNAAAGIPNFNGNKNDLTQNKKTNETEKDVAKPVSQSNKYRNFGAVIGFLAPIAADAVNLFKGKSFMNAFNWKQLAIASPLVALAGVGIGAFIDSCLRANKAKEALQS